MPANERAIDVGRTRHEARVLVDPLIGVSGEQNHAAGDIQPVTSKRVEVCRAGFDATHLVRSATAAGPLPDDHPAAALWWRILDQLPSQMPKASVLRGASAPLLWLT
ncbi:MAG TPA: hypothetical protein VI094_12485 [Propionibacteriaceae bacterium]